MRRRLQGSLTPGSKNGDQRQGGRPDHRPGATAVFGHSGNGEADARDHGDGNDERPRQDHPSLRRRRSIALLFVYAWVVYALIQGGGLVISEPYLQTLHIAPRAAQGATGDGYAQALIKLDRTLPASDRVLVIWRRQDNQPTVAFWYGYFWSTYWLYPRPVDIVTSPASTAGNYTTLLDVRSTGALQIDTPAGYAVTASFSYADQVVTVLRRDHA